EALASLEAAGELEVEDRAGAAGEVPLGALVARVLRQLGVDDGRHVRLLLEPLDQRASVLDVTLGAQAQRLEALEEKKRVLRGEGRSLVTQRLGAGPDRERDVAERTVLAEHVAVDQAVIAGAGLTEAGVAAVAPVEGAEVHDQAPDGRAVTVDP